MNKIYNVVDFFCGVGGGAIGLHQTNRVKTIFAVDFWDKACQQYRNYFPNVNIACEDISKIDEEDIKNFLNRKQIDIVLGSPPCQNFSMLNRKNVINKIDNGDNSVYDKNNLFKEFLRCVNIIKPKVVIMENVKGILTMKNEYGEYIIDEIIKAYNSIGYRLEYRVIHCDLLGLPQKRNRVIFIATNIDKFNIEFVTDNGFRSTVKDAFKDIENTLNNYTNKTSELTLKRIEQILPGKSMKDLSLDNPFKTKAQFDNSYRRLVWNEPSITITNICKNMILHPEENRILTVREGLRLQGFPDTFNFIEEKSKDNKIKNIRDMYLMVANAIPPLLTYTIGMSIIRELDRLEKID